MRFSQRIGKVSVREVLQVESIDMLLKNKIWNLIIEGFFPQFEDSISSGNDTELKSVCTYLWKEFYGQPVDTIATYYNSGIISTEGFISFVRDWFYKADWYEVYDLVEELVHIDSALKRGEFDKKCNAVFKRELSGYRLINGQVVQINSDEEIASIEEAISSKDKWNPVKIHLINALSKLSDRDSPDYRNSVKESISAVEAFCVILTGDKSATLGKALVLIEREHGLHKALRTAFSAIYGYTSDASGIRHALLETDSVDFEEAKFMLVSCSAFINYLKSKTIVE
jgi:hypothetical protein